jgi:transcriptional regulator with XRE-family HTH domain
MVDMRKLVGRNVARLRAARGLTQEQLAERSGFSQQYLSGLEQGLRNPTIVSVHQIAQALGVSHLELLALEEGKPSEHAQDRDGRRGRP